MEGIVGEGRQGQGRKGGPKGGREGRRCSEGRRKAGREEAKAHPEDGEDRGRAGRPDLEGLQARGREGEGRGPAERDLEGTGPDKQGRLEAGDKVREERDDQ